MSVYENPGPSLGDVHAWQGLRVLEFGVDWCPHCQTAQPVMADALGRFPGIPLVRVEDGRGRPLGRAFRVKLWPTFVLLRNGVETGRLVRPVSADAVDRILAEWVSSAGRTEGS